MKRRMWTKFGPPTSLSITVALVLLVFVEGLALLGQVSYPYYQTDISKFFQNVASDLFWAIVPLAPGTYLLLLYSSPVRCILEVAGRLSARFERIEAWVSRPLLSPITKLFTSSKTQGSLSRVELGVLLGGLIFASLVSFTPYRPDLNPQGRLVGTDAPLYFAWVAEMLRRGTGGAIGYAFVGADGGARPIVLLILYGLAEAVGGSSDAAIRLIPAILAPLLAVTSFLFVFYGLGDRRAAILAAVLSGCSYQLSVGVWAGYYANWLGLAESYLLLTCFLVFSKSLSKRIYLLMFPISLGLLFTHPWTWTILISLVVLVTFDRFARGREVGFLKLIVLLVVVNLLVDLSRMLVLGSYGAATGAYDIATGASVANVGSLWPNSVQALTQYYDGYFANSLYITLALLAVLSFYKAKDLFSRITVLWIALLALPFPLLGSLLESRLVYVTPVPVLAAIGMSMVARNISGQWQRILFFTCVALLGANATLQAMIQLVSLP